MLAAPESSDSSSGEDEEEVEGLNNNKKRTRRAVKWEPAPEATNVSEAEAKTFIIVQDTWRYRKTEINKCGSKKDKYVCSKSSMCKAALYMILFIVNFNFVFLFRVLSYLREIL